MNTNLVHIVTLIIFILRAYAKIASLVDSI